ncbi:MAG: glycerol dehydrogenase [Deltaproteobacteria bacterium]|nr:glycerol dehydrogenase [Deltaproteobacteria bacterium]
MRKILVSPSKYIQGPGELSHIAAHAAKLGRKALVVISVSGQQRFHAELTTRQAGDDAQLLFGAFQGECSKKEIKRLELAARDQGCDIVIGVGGGKALDTAKCVAHFAKLPCIVAPTIASTDAPCSSLSVIYSDQGAFEEYIHFDRNPDLVIVDTQAIAQAPTRFLIAGMGDALSTHFEARACQRSFAKNIPGGNSTKAGFAIAKLCYETLLEDGEKAIAASEAKAVTPALENIIEANTLLSGLGFESSGLAAAHSVHNGLTALSETHKMYHGEKVAFGTLTQLVLENAPKSELAEVINFCLRVGLPVCLADLGVTHVDHERLMEVATLATASGETIHNLPFVVSAIDVYAAIVTADKLGSKAKTKFVSP